MFAVVNFQRVPFRSLLIGVICAIALGACSSDGRELREPGTGGATPRPVPIPTTTVDMFTNTLDGEFALRSPNVAPASFLPHRYSIAGANISPELHWRNVPEGTVELAIVLTDLTAEDQVLWLIAGLDPTSVQLFEGLVPPGATQGENDRGQIGWSGPSPAPGDDAHSYVFRLFALFEPSGLQGGELAAGTIPDLEAIAHGVTELVVFYQEFETIG